MIHWRVREEMWWTFVLVVLIAAAIGATYTLLIGGQLFVPSPE